MLFKEEVPLPPALCAALKAAAAGAPEGMEVAEDATSSLGRNSPDGENVMEFP